MNQDEEILGRLAEAIIDETPVDWEGEATQHPELASRLHQLQILKRIAEAHGGDPSARNSGREQLREKARERALFQWGHLEVVEKLGEGTFGEVYRAYDPLLDREVALKLLREDDGSLPLRQRRFLDEAVRLARIRHPNVLAIHGADVRNGRAGFWSDLLDGVSLEERLRSDLLFGPGEAAAIGLEICRALAAVHAAGIVHGDVKASNIVRDGEGRYVLVDFGAGVELDSQIEGKGVLLLDRALSPAGTPLNLAPELLQGEEPAPASDIYALGVLLYRLVSGRYPVPAANLADLAEKHRTGARVPLRDVRPDLPSAFLRAVERAVSPEPASRFASAGSMEEALAEAMGAGSESRSRSEPGSRSESRPAMRGRTVRWIFGLAAAAVVAVCLSVLLRDGPRQSSNDRSAIRPSSPAANPDLATIPGPATATGSEAEHASPTQSPPVDQRAPRPLEVTANLYRSRGGAKEALPAGALVHPGDALFMEVRGSEPLHVYILNEDQEGSVFVLFPVAGLETQNPITAGAWQRLPGTRGGTAQDWIVTSGRGEENFLWIASRSPLPELERQIAGFASVEPGRPIEYARLDVDPLVVERGVGGIRSSDPTTQGTAGLLSPIARRLLETASDPRGLWIKEFALHNLGS